MSFLQAATITFLGETGVAFRLPFRRRVDRRRAAAYAGRFLRRQELGWTSGCPGRPDMDALDGIVFSKREGLDYTVVLVTSDGILRRWLALPPHPADAALQADPDTAFADGRLDSSVIDQASWRAVFAVMPIARPAGVDVASAFLGTGGNGDLFWPPRLIDAYVRKGDRVLIANAALETKFAAREACDAPRRAAEAKARLAQPPEFMRLTQEAADAFNDCWMKRGRDQPAFAAALRQAQALVDDLAASVMR
jgi:hypothetical protein